MKHSLALAAVFALIMSSAAFAGVQDFGKFTIDVAEGWTASSQKGTAVIIKNDNSAWLTISIDSTDGMTKEQLAEAFISEFRKSGAYTEVSEPEAHKGGNYSWDMKTTAGAESNAILTVEGGNFMLLVMTNIQAAPNDFSAMIDSIKDK